MRSTAADRTDLSLTIYADGRAMVRDHRRLMLPQGRSTLAYSDVSEQLKPASALFREQGGMPTLKVLERTFEFDLIEPRRILEKSLDAPVRVRLDAASAPLEGVLRGTPHRAFWSAPRTPMEAKLAPLAPLKRLARINPYRRQLLPESLEGVVETRDGFVSARPDEVQLLTLPPGLRARPTLLQTVDSPTSGLREVMLAYLTEGLSWQATYRATLHADGRQLDLTSFVTLRNETSTAFPEATLQLVAGAPNRAIEEEDLSDPDRARIDRTATVSAVTVEVMAAAIREEKISEYLLLTLPRLTTVKAGQEKQILLFHREGIPVAYHWNSSASFDGYYPQYSQWECAYRAIRIENAKDGPLGRPCPRGPVYLGHGDILLTASNLGYPWEAGNLPSHSIEIEDTPMGERLDLPVGDDPRVQVRVEPIEWRDETNWEHFWLHARLTSCDCPPSPERGTGVVNLRNNREEPVPLTLTLYNHRIEALGASVAFKRVGPDVIQVETLLKPRETRTIRFNLRKS